MEPRTASLLAEAETAAERGDWRAAYDLGAQLRGTGEELPAAAMAVHGRAAWWLGQVHESLELTEAAHERYLAQGDREQAARHAVQAANVWFLRGEDALGAAWLGRAQRLLEGRPPGLAHGVIRYAESLALLHGPDPGGAAPIAREVAALGHRLGEPTLTALGLSVEGWARARCGAAADGLRLLDEAMLPVVAGQVLPEFAGSVLCSMIQVCHELADPERARRWTATTERWCAGFSEAAVFTGICRVHRIQLHVLAGEWATAEHQALSLVQDIDGLEASVVGECWLQLAQTYRLRGDLDRAAAAIEQARGLGSPAEPEESLLALARGRTAAAAEGLADALARAGDVPLRRSPLLLATVQVAMQAGDPVTAGRAAEELRAISAAVATPGMRAWADEATGMAALVADGYDVAAAALRRAVGGYEALGAPYRAAQARLLLAACLDRLGESGDARAQDQLAVRLLDRLGAPRPAQDRGHATPPGGLTEREVEVLALVARGSTNRQVAAALRITEKTVGRHLSNVYLKLDVASRTAAAAWAHDHGLRAPDHG